MDGYFREGHWDSVDLPALLGRIEQQLEALTAAREAEADRAVSEASDNTRSA